MAGAEFTVTKQNGEFIGNFITASDGTIVIQSVEPGYYIIGETKCPTGYILDKTSKNIEVKPYIPTVITFTNKPLSGIEILKVDYFTQNALSGAVFEITRANGERIGEYTTDGNGKIIVCDLTNGVYIVSEIKAPQGYTIDKIPKNVTVKSGKLETVKFADKPLSGIEIFKTDAVTHKALSGATFEITRANGEKIGNYVTDRTGKIIVHGLDEDVYTYIRSRQ